MAENPGVSGIGVTPLVGGQAVSTSNPLPVDVTVTAMGPIELVDNVSGASVPAAGQAEGFAFGEALLVAPVNAGAAVSAANPLPVTAAVTSTTPIQAVDAASGATVQAAAQSEGFAHGEALLVAPVNAGAAVSAANPLPVTATVTSQAPSKAVDSVSGATVTLAAISEGFANGEALSVAQIVAGAPVANANPVPVNAGGIFLGQTLNNFYQVVGNGATVVIAAGVAGKSIYLVNCLLAMDTAASTGNAIFQDVTGSATFLLLSAPAGSTVYGPIASPTAPYIMKLPVGHGLQVLGASSVANTAAVFAQYYQF